MAVTLNQLNARVPNGTAVYAALFTTLPDSDGAGGVEATGSGYARVAHSAWIDETIDSLLYRKNNGTIEFAALTGALTGIVGWGFYDAATVGNLKAFGPIVDMAGDNVTRNLAAGDVPRFIDQEILIGGSATVGAGGGINGESGELDVVDEASLAKLQAYLPTGLAWPRDADAEMTALVRALAYEYSRISKRVMDFLLTECDPRTATEMLEDFERVYGLPEAGQTLGATLAARRVALHGKILGSVDPTVANITAIALDLGYAIVIREYRPADLFKCTSACNDPLITSSWMFYWTVTTPSGAADAQLSYALQSIAPLHTQLNLVFT